MVVLFAVLTDVDNKGSWKECLNMDGIRLPTGYYIGVSATTGDLSDNHDIIGVRLYQLDTENDEKLIEERRNILPSATFHEPPRGQCCWWSHKARKTAKGFFSSSSIGCFYFNIVKHHPACATLSAGSTKQSHDQSMVIVQPTFFILKTCFSMLFWFDFRTSTRYSVFWIVGENIPLDDVGSHHHHQFSRGWYHVLPKSTRTIEEAILLKFFIFFFAT